MIVACFDSFRKPKEHRIIKRSGNRCVHLKSRSPEAYLDSRALPIRCHRRADVIRGGVGRADMVGSSASLLTRISELASFTVHPGNSISWPMLVTTSPTEQRYVPTLRARRFAVLGSPDCMRRPGGFGVEDERLIGLSQHLPLQIGRTSILPLGIPRTHPSKIHHLEALICRNASVSRALHITSC